MGEIETSRRPWYRNADFLRDHAALALQLLLLLRLMESDVALRVATFLGLPSYVDGVTPELSELRHDFVRGPWLSDTAIPDAGLKHVGGATGVEELSLDGTRVTDEGLRTLHGLSRLNRLKLDRTQVTDAGVAELKAALPALIVER